MPIGFTVLTQGSDNVDRAGYTTASVTPTADRLVLACCLVTDDATTVTPAVSGNGLTWATAASVEHSAVFRRLGLFRARGSAPSAGGVTFSWGLSTMTSAAWAILELTDVLGNIGDNGAGAIRGAAVTGETDATQTSLTMMLPAFDRIENAALGLFFHAVNEAITPGADFTELAEQFYTLPGSGFQVEWKVNDTTVDASAATADRWLGITVELRQLVAPRSLLGVNG